MNYIDIIIILLLIGGGIAGAHNGFFKQTVILVGTILCFILAWVLKDSIANFLSFNLPFFSFNGIKALNIVFYQLAAFIGLLAIFTAILIVIIQITGIFEKLLKLTIILGIPSKILGFVIGIIEMYIIVFAVLFFAKQPIFDQEYIEESYLAPIVLESSPGLSNIVSRYSDAVEDVFLITKEYEDKKDIDTTNKEIVDALLKHKVIDKDYINKLVKQGKIVYEEEDKNDKEV